MHYYYYCTHERCASNYEAQRTVHEIACLHMSICDVDTNAFAGHSSQAQTTNVRPTLLPHTTLPQVQMGHPEERTR